jgi:hypothetical protein
MSRRRAFLGAFVLSFSAYLIPLFNVHAGLIPLGITLAGLAEPSVYSLAALAVALAIQAILFALFYWLLRGLRWRNWLVLIAAVPLLVYGANLSVLYAVPLMVLVERDTRPETGDLAKVCSVPGVILAQVNSGADLSLERAGEAWVIRQDDRLRARLTMPGCRLTNVAAPRVGSTMDHVAPGGYLLFRRDDGNLVHVGPDRAAPLAVTAPLPGKYWSPILSDDGRTLAWLDRKPVKTGPRPYRLRLLHMNTARASGDGEETIALDLPPRDQFELIGADTERGRFTLARFRNGILVIDRQGRTITEPVSPGGIYDARWGFRWLDGGWVAWDGYREEGRSRVVWSLPAGSGDVVIPKGRKVESLSVDPSGRHIAVSVATGLSIGSTKSAVFLLRTADGQELFRRYHPTFSRNRLAFLGTDYLAITRNENGQSFVDVYRVP